MNDNPISDALQSLGGMANKAAAPERADPGPGDVGPTVETKATALVTLQMSADEVGEWRKRVERSRQRRKSREEKWDILLKEYLPKVSASGVAEDVKVNAHFRNVHSKIGQLFYRSPDLILTPKDPGPASNQMPNPQAAMAQPGQPPPPPLTLEDVISVKQAVLQDKLGRDDINVVRLFDELLFDVLAWAGIGCSKLGYRCVQKTIQQPKMQPAPPPPPMMGGGMGGAPIVAPGIGMPMNGPAAGGPPPPQGPPPMVPMMDPTGQPVMEPVQVTIYDEWYWRRFSPKKILVGDDLRSTRYDEDSTYMGMDFYMSPKRAMSVYGLTEEEASKAAEDDDIHKYDEDHQGADKPPGLVHGVELWVKASIFTDEPHPLAINQLVLIDGIEDRPVVWRPSPDQEFDPTTGKLTDNSLIGFPIRILTIRDLADSPFPPADAAFTNTNIKELSTYRQQSVKLRDAAIGKYLYDKGAFDDTEIEKIKAADVGAYIGVEEGNLQKGPNAVITTTAQIRQSIDDYKGAELLKQDMDETLGIGSNQAGTPEATVRTATEIANVQSAVAGRNDKELSHTIDHYLAGARMIDSLLMRYADQQEYVHITGQDGARRMQMWNNQMISGRFLYDIAPDSQVRVDTARDFQQLLNFYNLAAQDPSFNRTYILRRLARMRGLDPSKIIAPPMPPPPHAVPPSIGFSFKGEDLLNPIVLQILEKAELIQPVGAGPMPGPGGPPAAGPLNKHLASNSGGMQNAPGAENHRANQPQHPAAMPAPPGQTHPGIPHPPKPGVM